MERMDLDILMIRVRMHLAHHRFVKARGLLEHVLEMEPGHGIAHGMMAWVCWQLLDDAERATVHYRAAIHFAPTHVPHYMAFAQLLADTGRVDDLRTLHGTAISVAGIDKAALHELLATALERAERFAEAADAFRDAARATHEVSETQRLMHQHARVRARVRHPLWKRLLQA